VTSIQIKDVPAEVHAELRRRAALAGRSLQEYLLARLEEEVRHPDLDELLARAGGRSGGRVPFAAAVAAIRQDRETH
jgi:plasmid stability protein